MNTHRHHPDPLDPLDVAPVAIRHPYDQRPPIFPYVPARDLELIRADYLAALTEPLAGIALGAYDHRIIAWLAGWDVPTVGTVASLLHRARAAAPLAGDAR